MVWINNLSDEHQGTLWGRNGTLGDNCWNVAPRTECARAS